MQMHSICNANFFLSYAFAMQISICYYIYYLYSNYIKKYKRKKNRRIYGKTEIIF